MNSHISASNFAAAPMTTTNQMISFDIDHLKCLAADKELISFDIFDTLLIRTAVHPETVFYLIEYVYGFKGFVALRKEAENAARKAAGIHGREDTTLDEIYSILSRHGNTYKNAQVLECQLEEHFLVANPEMLKFYRWCCEKEKQIVAVSDMYHDSEFLNSVLRSRGYDINDILVSSDKGRLKYSGGLFQEMLSLTATQPEDVLHIGDNWHADVRGGRSVGIESCLYPKLRIQAAAAPLLPARLQNLDEAHVYESITYGLGIFQWASRGKPLDKSEYPWWLGYTFVAPLSLLFLEWLYRDCKANNLTEIYFLRRDGEIWHRIWEQRYPDVKSTLIYGNRKLLQDASLADLLHVDEFPRDHSIAFRISHGDNIMDICDHLGFSQRLTDAAQEQLNDNGLWDKADIPERLALFLKYIQSNRMAWMEYSDIHRQSMSSYYSDLGLSKDRRHEVAVVDIGWRLSSYKSLSSIIGFEPIAYFFGIAEGAYFSEKCQGFVFDYGLPRCAFNLYKPHFIEVLETIFGGTEPTALKLTHRDGKTEVEFDHVDTVEQARIDFIARMYSGALEFTKNSGYLSQVIKRMPAEMLRTSATTIVDEGVNAPDSEFYRALSKLEFSAYAGKSDTTKKSLGQVWGDAMQSRQNIAEISGEPNTVFDPRINQWVAQHVLSWQPSLTTELLILRRLNKYVNMIEKSGFMDDEWYFAQYPDIKGSGLSATEHYVRHGVLEGRNPNSKFDTFGYLRTSVDVMAAGENPLIHYIKFGQFEQRGH